MERDRNHLKKVFDVLSFIIDYINWEHYPPTIREISEASGVKSTSHVVKILDELTEEGSIERGAKTGKI